MKNWIQSLARRLGYEVRRIRSPLEQAALVPGMSSEDMAVLERIAPFTLTTVERQVALIHAVRYLARRRIEGCMVECGTWRGGNMMAVALTLAQEHATDRALLLYDTFDGMSPPTEEDRTADGTLAATLLAKTPRGTGMWCYASIDDARTNMLSTGYPEPRVRLIKGLVEHTIPAQSPPAPIALLRLDTDWYESTRHCLIHLFPLLCEGGILIIDDYGHWRGARKAVDEYLAGQPRPYYLHQVDESCRLLMKV